MRQGKTTDIQYQDFSLGLFRAIHDAGRTKTARTKGERQRGENVAVNAISRDQPPLFGVLNLNYAVPQGSTLAGTTSHSIAIVLQEETCSFFQISPLPIKPRYTRCCALLNKDSFVPAENRDPFTAILAHAKETEPTAQSRP
jgi:hypothetical protein